MKKTIILTIIIILIGVLIYVHNRPKTNSPAGNFTNNSASTHPDMSNGTFNIEHEDVTLKSGTNVSPIAPDSELNLETTLTDIVGYGDLNGDGKEDEVGVIVQSGGGSGVFIYLAGYVSAPVSYKGTNAIFIGDRVSPESITINNGIITLTYLDRAAGVAFAEDPTVETTKQFIYKSGELQER